MATANLIHLSKTIDDNGLITINWSADGVESGGVTYNITLLVLPNETTPATPLKGIKFLAQIDGGNEEPLEFQSADLGCMLALRAEDGETIAVWRGGPTRLNLYTPA